MSILRTYVIVFVLGWAIWLFTDKSPSPPTQGPPFSGAYPVQSAPWIQTPTGPRGQGMLAELQHGVDQIRVGRYREGVVYLWREQSWLLAGVLTLLLRLLLPLLPSHGESRRHTRSNKGHSRVD
jgi:hypothetical protein